MPESTAAERAAKQAKIKYYRGYEYNDYAQTNKLVLVCICLMRLLANFYGGQVQMLQARLKAL
jgi:hypothetical protein